MPHFFRIPRNPSCSQLEDLNARLQRISEYEYITLSLARRTGAKFFSESSIAQVIAHISTSRGKLVIRDTHDSWKAPRFLTKIDGVSALVYSQLFASTHLENTKKLQVPESIFRSLKSRLVTSGLLEEQGPTRTLIAIDPVCPMPVELGGPFVRKNCFHTIFRKMLSQYEHGFTRKSATRHRAEQQLVSFIYETFQNTVEHGRFTKERELLCGIRYFRIHVYIGNSVDDLKRRAVGFPELETYLQRPRMKGSQKRFLELSISDAGQGIVSHYINSRTKPKRDNYDREQLLQELIGGTLSSKRSMSGVGLGLPNALAALRELSAFLSLRTEEFWLYRDFADSSNVPGNGRHLFPVNKIDSIAPLAGTQFNVLIDFPM